MKKTLLGLSILCIMLFSFTTIGCESTDWAVLANSLAAASSGLTSSYTGTSGSGSSGSSGSSGAGNRITIVNRTGYTVYYAYVSHETSRSWEEDVLGSSVLMSGNSVNVNLPRGGRWDIKLVDVDGDSYTKFGINTGSTVTFYLSDID